MKRIDVSTPRNQGARAVVDDQDYDDVARFKWYVTKGGYVARSLPKPAGGIEYLHRRLMGEPPCLVDHANRDPLDNRRANLRLADRQKNAANMRSKSRCGLKGVSFHPQSGKWRARIMVSGRQISLGLHSTPELAHSAYVAAARRAFGGFARAG